MLFLSADPFSVWGAGGLGGGVANVMTLFLAKPLEFCMLAAALQSRIHCGSGTVTSQAFQARQNGQNPEWTPGSDHSIR